MARYRNVTEWYVTLHNKTPLCSDTVTGRHPALTPSSPQGSLLESPSGPSPNPQLRPPTPCTALHCTALHTSHTDGNRGLVLG